MNYFTAAAAVLAVLGFFGGPVRAQSGDADRDKRIAEIEKELAGLRGKILALEAELTRLRPARQAADVEPLRVLKGHKGDVVFLHFSPDGAELFAVATGGPRREWIKWDVPQGKQKEAVNEPEAGVRAWIFDISADHGTLAYLKRATSGTDPERPMLDRFSIDVRGVGGAFVGRRNAYNTTYNLALSRDGKFLAASEYVPPTKESHIEVWDVEAQNRLNVLVRKGEVVQDLQYSPDGKHLVAIIDGDVVVWKAGTLKLLDRKSLNVKVGAALAMDREGKTLAVVTTEGRKVRLIGLVDGEEKRALEPHTAPLLCLAWSHDGKYVAAGSEDHSFLVWDAQTGKRLAAVEGHANAVTAVAFTRDGKTLATGARDSSVKLWGLAQVLGK